MADLEVWATPPQNKQMSGQCGESQHSFKKRLLQKISNLNGMFPNKFPGEFYCGFFGAVFLGEKQKTPPKHSQQIEIRIWQFHNQHPHCKDLVLTLLIVLKKEQGPSCVENLGQSFACSLLSQRPRKHNIHTHTPADNP